MGFTIEQAKKLKANGQIKWDTDRLSAAVKNANQYLNEVQAQANGTAANSWTMQEYEKRQSQLDEHKAQLDYLNLYANSLKDTDSKAYEEIHGTWDMLETGLRNAGKYFDTVKNNNLYPQLDTHIQAYQEQKNKAVKDVRSGNISLSDAEDKYGMDIDVLREGVVEANKAEKLAPLENKFGSMSYNELREVLKNPVNRGTELVNEVNKWFEQEGINPGADPDGEAHGLAYKAVAEKSGFSEKKVKKIYEQYKENQFRTNYDSHALSDAEKDYIYSRMAEIGTPQQEQNTYDSLPKSGQIYAPLKGKLYQGIELGKEKRLYLDAVEKDPEIKDILVKLDEADRASKNSENYTGFQGVAKAYNMSVNQKNEAIRELAEKGYDDPDTMLKYYRRIKEREKAAEINRGFENFAGQNGFTAALATVASVPINMGGSLVDVLKYAAANLDKATGGDGYVDPTTTANYTAQSIRNKVTEMIDNGTKDAGAWNYWAKQLYSTATSMGDMALAAAVNLIPYVGRAASAAMFFSSAGVNSANEVIQNGGTLEQATWTLAAHGAAELIFEKFSLEQLSALKATANVKGVKDIVINTLKTAFTEGSEEFFTDVANAITDRIINGDLSKFEISVRRYIAEGDDEETARSKAAGEFAEQLRDSFIGGAISGAAFGGAVSAANRITDINQFRAAAGDYRDKIPVLREMPETFAKIVPQAIEKAKNSGNKKAEGIAKGLEKELDSNGGDYTALKDADLANLFILTEEAENAEFKEKRANEQNENEVQRKNTQRDIDRLIAKGVSQTDAEMILNARDYEENEEEYKRKSKVKLIDDYIAEAGDRSDYGVSGEIKKNIQVVEANRFNDKAVVTTEDGKVIEIKGDGFGESHPDGISVIDRSGNEHIAKRIAAVVNDKGKNRVMLETNKGELIYADNVTAQGHLGALLDYAADYDTTGAQIYVSQYDVYAKHAKEQGRSANVQDYDTAFEKLYNVARQQGTTYQNAAVNRNYRREFNVLGNEVAKAAFTAGNKDLAVQGERMRAAGVQGNVAALTVKNADVSFEDGTNERAVDATVWKMLERLSAKTGRKIVLTDDVDVNENAHYDRSNGVIYIRADLNDMYMLPVALHEAVHGIAQTSPGDFETLKQFVFNTLNAQGRNVDFLLDDIRRKYGEDAPTEQDVLEEFVCNSVMAIATDEKALKTALGLKENQSFLEKIADVLSKLVQRINDFIGDVTRNSNRQAQAFIGNAQALERMAEMFSQAADRDKQTRAVAAEDRENKVIGKQKNNTAKEGGVKYSLKDIPSEAEIINNINTVANNMLPVINLTGQEFKKGKDDLVTQVYDYYKSIGGVVSTPYGKVLLDRNGIKSSLGHGIGRNKAIAFKAVPEVLKNGKIIDYQVNWKKRGYNTAVLSAPIKIANDDYYLAAIVIEEKDRNSFYLHEVTLQKKDTTVFKTGTVKNGTPSTGISSIFSLLQKLIDVNSKDINTPKSKNDLSSDIRYAVDDDLTDGFFNFGDLFEPEQKRVLEDALKADPERVATMSLNAIAKTARKVQNIAANIKLENSEFGKIAHQILRKYEIHEKHETGVKEKLAKTIEAFTADLESNKSVEEALDSFVNECKDYILQSGDYGWIDPMYEEAYKSLRNILQNTTVVIDEYRYNDVINSYGSLKNYAKALGVMHVVKEENAKKGGLTPYDILENYYSEYGWTSPNGYVGEYLENLDSFEAINELEYLLNSSKIAPQFINRYKEGIYGISVEQAAVDMAVDIMSEINTRKANKIVTEKNAKAADIRAMAKAKLENETAKTAREKARAERFKQDLEKEKQKRRDEIKQLRERLAYGGQKSSERIAKMRKRIALLEDETQSQKAVIREVDKGYRDQFYDRQSRNQSVKSLARELDMFTKKLENKGNNAWYIPDVMKKPMKELLLKFKTFAEKDGGDQASYFGNFREIDGIASSVDELVKAYETLKGSENDTFSFKVDEEIYDEYVKELLADLAKDIEGKNIYTMTTEELKDLAGLMKELRVQISEANKQIGRNEKITHIEAGRRVINEIDKVNGEKLNKAQKLLAGAGLQFLNVKRAIRMMTGYNDNAELMKQFEMINEGNRKALFWQMEQEKKFNDLVNNHEEEYKKSCNEVISVKWFNKRGKEQTVKLTKMQALQIVMTWERENRVKNMVHLKTGGVVIADPEIVAKGKGKAFANKQEFTELDENLISELNKQMGAFERSYRKLAEEYFNGAGKEAINEVMLKIKRHTIANSDYYIPIKVDQNYTQSDIEALKYDATIEGRGSYKQTVYSELPVMITSLNAVIDRHIKDTATLYGLAIPLRNFKGMYITTITNLKQGNREIKSVKKSIENKFGKNGKTFLERMVTDLEAGRNNQDNAFETAMGHIYNARVKTALIANISVCIKQAASYFTAGRYLSTSDLTKGLVSYWIHHAFSKKRFARVCREIDAHTAQHYIRRKGMSVQEVADMMNSSRLARKAPTIVNPVKWIQAVDCATTAALWDATKMSVDREYKKAGKKIGTQAYWDEVTERYDTVIEDTQPMYDSLHRAEIQKGGGNLAKAVKPFMTQPLQNTGVLYDAAAEFAVKHDKESARNFGKAVASQATSLAVFSLMTAAAMFILCRKDKYKDEKTGEVTFESFMGAYFSDCFDNAVNIIAPYGGNLVESIIKDATKMINEGKLSEPTNLLDVAQVSFINQMYSGLYQSWGKISEQFSRFGTEKNVDVEVLITSIFDIPGTISEIFGIPYNNGKRIVLGFLHHIRSINHYGLIDNRGDFDTDHVPYHVVKAFDSGNTEKAGELKRMWKEQLLYDGKTEEAANNAILAGISKQLAKNETLQAAAIAKESGHVQVYDKLFNELLQKGFSNDEIKNAGDKVINDIKQTLKKNNVTDYDNAVSKLLDTGFDEDSAERLAKEHIDSLTPKETNGKARYDYNDAFEALKDGDTERYETVKAYLMEFKNKTSEDFDKAVLSSTRTDPIIEAYEKAYDNGDDKEFKRLRTLLERIFGTEGISKALERYDKRKEGEE